MNNISAPVLVVGNGPNQIDGGYSWRDLLSQLRQFVGSGQLANHDEKKPFPLLYEELVLQGYSTNGISEEAIKDFICEETKKLKPNHIHNRIINSKFDQILTTNYDHTLETAASSSFQVLPEIGRYKERRYSLFRNYSFQTEGQKTIWHLHGDQEKPETVLLGYDHYSGYLKSKYRYVREGYNWDKEAWSPLVKQLKYGEPGAPFYRSWIDFFFTRDIYILGLSLDFVEFHLWWLLSFRPRAEIRSEIMRNRLTYIYRDYDKSLSDELRAKLSLFEGMGIQAHAIKVDSNWTDFYNIALDWVDNDMINKY
jgi:SIR2-like domain